MWRSAWRFAPLGNFSRRQILLTVAEVEWA